MIIVKRKGYEEEYDERKVYASIYAACKNVHMDDKGAEKIADKVSKEISNWIKDQKGVTYKDIFDKVAAALSKHSKDASFMYETHLDVS